MAGPTFTEPRRSEQAIDDAFVGQRRIVRQKRFNFFRRRREADQIECHATKQRRFIGRLIWGHTPIAKRETNELVAQLQMDIAPAYPLTAKVKSWLRTVRLHRGRDVEITEAFELSETSGETTLNLLTPLEANTSQPGQVILHAIAQNERSQVNVRLEYDATKLAPTVDRIPMTDPRLAKSWGTHLNHLVLHARSPALKDTWVLRLKEN